MSRDAVVWNLDARNRPELEVEIEIEVVAPGIEEPWLVGWFVDDGVPVGDVRVIHDVAPRGYAQAFRAAS